MIVLEGPDGGGKSTLAHRLSEVLNWPVVKSKGPPADQEELLARIDAYRKMGPYIIFDRHPIVSNTIYGKVSMRPEIPKFMIDQFYFGHGFLIYVRSTSPKRATADRAFDTPEHVNMYKENYQTLVDYYDEWAVHHANYIYRMYDLPHPLIAAVRSYAMSIEASPLAEKR